jgi:hypothetical protein
MGDGRIFLTISAPHSLMTTYRMNLISAIYISLDSTFNLKSKKAMTSNIIHARDKLKKRKEMCARKYVWTGRKN